MKRLLSSFLALAVCQVICCYGKSVTVSEMEKLTDKQLEKLIEKLVGESDDDTVGADSVGGVKRLDRDKRRNSRKKSRDGSLKKNDKGGVRRDWTPRKDLGNVANGTVSLESCNDGGELQRNMDTQEAHCPEGFFVGVDLVQNWSKVKNKKVHEECRKKGDSTNTILVRPACLDKRSSHVGVALNAGYSCFLGKDFWGCVSTDLILERTVKKVERRFYDNTVDEESRIDGTSYSLKFKGGEYLRDVNCVIYALIGLRWTNVKFRLDSPVGIKNSMKRVTPLVGAGLEKGVWDNWFLCCECEYFWKNDSSRAVASNPSISEYNFVHIAHDYKSGLHGYSLRVGLKFYF